MAKKNFVINEISSKIELHEIWLGYPARTLEFIYSEENKGGVGINGVLSYIGTLFGWMAAYSDLRSRRLR